MSKQWVSLGVMTALVLGMTNSQTPSPGAASPILHQVGTALAGVSAGDEFGNAVALNRAGTVVAVGSPQGSASLAAPGFTRVYHEVSGIWEQQGTLPLVGVAHSDLFGSSVALSDDGFTLAVGAPGSDASFSNAGAVSVYRFDQSSGEWVPVGSSLVGSAPSQQFGGAVSLDSTGTILAVGARVATGSNAMMSGIVQVYRWDDTSWLPLGARIDGAAMLDSFGEALALSSDGNTLAVGAPGHDTPHAGAGVTRVFSYDGTNAWVEKGSPVFGATADEKSGFAVALSATGDHLVVGSPEYSNDARGATIGAVRVFTWTNNVWNPQGEPLLGAAVGEGFGWAVSLSDDGARFVAGANNGPTSVFDLVDSNWELASEPLQGSTPGDGAGRSVALAGTSQRVALGAPGSDLVATNAGEVRVFEWPVTVVVARAKEVSEDRGTAGIHLHLAGPVGTSVSGSPVYFGASGVMPHSSLVVVLRTNTILATPDVLWSVTTDAHGNVDARNLLGDLSYGTYTLWAEGVHASGTGLRLTTNFSVGDTGRISALGRNFWSIW
jgi:hypothetical protein